MARRLPRWIRWGLVGALGALVVIQFVPYGRDHTNPPVTRPASFAPGPGLELARGACFDCHSNETAWPWYTNIAPASWLAQRDVDEGRATVNFSEWDRPQSEVDELIDVIRDGDMPPTSYTLIHPQAHLSDAERATLLDAMLRMLRDSPPIAGEDDR
ncbi:MAG TPA: heme-binding domain-containing protein [Actinomycetota bacterium]|nr:heme-binding domain-containing protein [Actinomycetota bacterium]